MRTKGAKNKENVRKLKAFLEKKNATRITTTTHKRNR